MRTMNLMAVLALVAAAHSISTRSASARDVPAQARAIRTFDLPTVRVYATVERDVPALAAQAPRVHDLPAVRVHAERRPADARMGVVARAGSRRESLAIPRGSARRGLIPERVAQARVDDRGERWIALACMIRMRLARVWPMQGGCNAGGSLSGQLRPRADVGMVQASLARRR